jgi:hypothetical protein
VIVSSYHYLVGPLVTAGALLVIVLMCRWVFSTSHRDARRMVAPQPRDYGLLVPVASVRTTADAEMLRAVLRDGGIRCTVTADEVLVFPADLTRARDLVSS